MIGEHRGLYMREEAVAHTEYLEDLRRWAVGRPTRGWVANQLRVPPELPWIFLLLVLRNVHAKFHAILWKSTAQGKLHSIFQLAQWDGEAWTRLLEVQWGFSPRLRTFGDKWWPACQSGDRPTSLLPQWLTPFGDHNLLIRTPIVVNHISISIASMSSM
jgi:hypothetical protein